MKPFLRVLALSVLGCVAAGELAAAPPGGRPGQISQSSTTTPKPTEAVGNFDASAVTVTYLPNATGGIERVVANESGDAKQIGLIRANLQRMADNFTEADFPAAAQVRRNDSTALGTLLAAPPGALRTQFVEIRGGAEVRFSSDNPKLVTAVHQWFEALQDPSAAKPAAAAGIAR